MVGDRAMAEIYVRDYPGDDYESNTSPYFAPLRAEGLSGLPRAYVMVGGLDLLRDGCVAYADRLMAARVATELDVFPGAFHGFENMVPDAAISKRAGAEYMRALRDALTQ
jgi:acetyl esterase/lipase